MTKKRVERRDRFSVDIYRKKSNRAEVVFRSEKMLYRLGNVEGCAALDRQFKAAFTNPGKATLIEMNSLRKRKWVAEISSIGDKTVLLVWELMNDGISLLRFSWQDSR